MKNFIKHKILLRYLSIITFITPVIAFASNDEKIKLNLISGDKLYLYLSLSFGILALFISYYLVKKVETHPINDEKMQRVGNAIREGVLVYFRQQIRVIVLFIIVLAFALYMLYKSHDDFTALSLAISFIGGIIVSYLAGYIGIFISTTTNTRAAYSALKSYKQPLEIAFQGGAVISLITVGMSLIATTLIFLVAGNNAMKLLIGFGFGGSLAALFLRVGGGIYKKAADVNRDAFGKLEQGISEDDSRNPGIIVDNVGDCAGMIADTLESYEITLIAAIILGAATASIFDHHIWMRLILFAFMARGIGVLGSIVGIFNVKGSDNINSNPLHSIHIGFVRSTAVIAICIIGLTWFMMGGDGKNPVTTTQFISFEEISINELKQIQKIRDQIAIQKKIEPYQVKAKDIQNHHDLKHFKLEGAKALQIIAQAIEFDLERVPKPKDLKGYHKVDFNNIQDKALKYSILEQSSEKYKDKDGIEREQVLNKFVDLKTAYFGKKVQLLRLKVTQTLPASSNQQSQPVSQEVLFGPFDQEKSELQLAIARARGIQIEILERIPVILYSNSKGDLLVGIEKSLDSIQRTQFMPLNYFTESSEKMQRLYEAHEKNTNQLMPKAKIAASAVIQHVTIEWWKFLTCVLIGILMAFVIKCLTEYYVSIYKKPLKEVANNATIGSAPIVTNGLAYGQESSMLSVFVMLISFITPFLIFPPTVYGGYILSFYGISLVGIGLLSTNGFIVAMSAFGSILDNAQGIFELPEANKDNHFALKSMRHLNAAGSTAKAFAKNFTIMTVMVSMIALLYSYIENTHLNLAGIKLEIPEIFLGMIIGGSTPYLFSSFFIHAVEKASLQLINEIRRQFRSNKDISIEIMKPDYNRCISIVNANVHKELLTPSILAILLPVIVSFGFAIGKPVSIINGIGFNLVGAQALGGFLIAAIISNQLMAIMFVNSGTMLSNSKKLIEDGFLGGKETEAYRASIVSDGIGDSFKDISGSILSSVIKIMILVALLLTPVIIQPLAQSIQFLITIFALTLFCLAIWWSKCSSYPLKKRPLLIDENFSSINEING